MLSFRRLLVPKPGDVRTRGVRALLWILGFVALSLLARSCFAGDDAAPLPAPIAAFKAAALSKKTTATITAATTTRHGADIANHLSPVGGHPFAAGARGFDTLQKCTEQPIRGSGKVPVLKSAPELAEQERLFPQVLPGGRWFPSHCLARHRVALVVPYRNRLSNLRVFLHHMHPFLQRQLLDYGVYVIEQSGTGDFNRAKLLNVGYEVAKVLHDYTCFIFHDVDMLPENYYNMYACQEKPFHISTCIDAMKYGSFYDTIFGGVSALRSEHIEKVNGFPNIYWGWGGEDDDMSIRLRFSGYEIARVNCTIGRYTMLKHGKQHANPIRMKLIRRSFFRIYKDGLNTLKYRVLDVAFKKLYTHVIVDLFRNVTERPAQ